MVLGTDGLRAVFNDRNAVLFPYGKQGVHVAHVAVEVDRDDRLGARGDGRFGAIRIDAPRIGQNIDKNRLCAKIGYGSGGGYPIGVGEDHFIAGPDSERRESYMQSSRATGGGDGVLDIQMGLKRFFESAIYS